MNGAEGPTGGQGAGSLEVVSGPDKGRTAALGQQTAIGRARESGLPLSDNEVSRAHAEVRFQDGHYLVRDLGSRNGVRVDDVRVEEAVLRDGQRIGLGKTAIVFRERCTEVPIEARLALLDKSDLLRGLSPDDRAALAGEMHVRFYPKGAVVRRQGQALESMLFVHQGQVRVSSINEGGGEKVVARLGPGASFGERALVGGTGGEQSLIAEADVWLLELSKRRLQALLKERPTAGQTIQLNVTVALRDAQVQAAAAAPEEEEHEARHDELRQLVTSTDVEIIGADNKTVQAKKKIEGWAKEEGALLITGPAGSGKKTFARYFHKVGPRAKQPYSELNLSEQEPGRTTATLFGEEAEGGAADGAGTIGYLEMMGEGTLTLLHAERLDAHQQMMLVTYLKRGWFQRAFGQASITSKARIVLVAGGTEDEVLAAFVPELRELLSKRKLSIPPLPARVADIPTLVEYLLKRQAAKTGKPLPGLTREAMDRLVSYTWPGNVRELKHVLKRAAIVAPAGIPIPVDFIFVVPPEKEAYRINLLRNERLRSVLRHPALSGLAVGTTTAFVLAVAAITAVGGLMPTGHPLQQTNLNPGMWLTWFIWFPALPFSALLLGRIWCAVCPIAFIADVFAKVARLNLPVPKLFKRLDFWLLLAAFVVVDSVEGLVGVDERPLVTALFLVLIIGSAVIVTFLFERRTFCRYLCPLSGWLGTYSTVSVFEVRGNKKVCQTRCGDYSCYKGTPQVPGCPMFLYPAAMTTNAECLMCGNCLKSCDNRGVQLNLRPPLQELWQNPQPTAAMGTFALVLAGVMLLHAFIELPWWPPIIGELAAHVLFVGFTVTGFVLVSVVSAAASREGLPQNMARFGLGYVPIALAGHLTHAAQTFLTEGITVIASYFVMVYWSLFNGVAIGSQPVTLPFAIGTQVVTLVDFQILALGILGSVVAIIKISRRAGAGEALGRALPHLLFLGLLSALFLYAYL